MAVGDIQFFDARPVRLLSSGATPEVYWYNGRPIVVYEYTEPSGGSGIFHFLRNSMGRGCM